MRHHGNLLTEGNIYKKMLGFALPILAGYFFQQLYNTVDALIVGNFLDADALAAVTSTSAYMYLLIGFVNSFSPSRFGWANLLCATLLMYALGRIHGKKEALEKERLLHE